VVRRHALLLAPTGPWWMHAGVHHKKKTTPAPTTPGSLIW